MADINLSDVVPWVFSGVGVFAIGAIGKFVWSLIKDSPEVHNNVEQNVTVNVKSDGSMDNNSAKDDIPNSLKVKTHILFIDDDTKFKVVSILKQAGWENTKIIKDLKSIDSVDVLNANILFVDVNGVGKYMGFKDEGLGLARAIKEKYPFKKIVIYSAESMGNRFHDALRQADDFLAKDAEPYQFQQVVERLAAEVNV